MPDDGNSGASFEQALAAIENIQKRVANGLSVCEILTIAHDSFHIITDYGGTIVELFREAQRRAN